MSVLCVLAGAGMLLAASVLAADPPPQPSKFRAVAPAVSKAEVPTPTPTPPAPTPTPFIGAVRSLYLESAGIDARFPVEARDVRQTRTGPVFEDPSRPERIAWYSNYGIPGWRGNNSIFAAHVNYVGYGNGPFAHLGDGSVWAGDALYVVMAEGSTYAYTVAWVDIIPLATIDMQQIVFPSLDANTERVTLISCGGTFIPTPQGGEYDSRVILVAERYVP